MRPLEYIIALIIISLLFGIFVGYQFRGCNPPKPQVITETITDTLYIDRPIEVIKQLPAKVVYKDRIVNQETISTKTYEADTVLADCGELHIELYQLSDSAYFDIRFKPYPKEILHEVEYIKCPEPTFFKKPVINLIAGYIVGAGSVLLVLFATK